MNPQGEFRYEITTWQVKRLILPSYKLSRNHVTADVCLVGARKTFNYFSIVLSSVPTF